jgi:hypothetical protein
MKRRYEGITLLEAVLVLAVGASIILFSFRQYESFREDADVLQLKTNVDQLFQAAAGYYQANCPQGKLLDPTIATNPKAIDITNDLITPGYLEASFPTPNPLVDSTGPGSGYVVQFNEYTMPRTIPVCADPPACDISTPQQIGTIVMWQIQVSVLMKNTSPGQLAEFQNYLEADCLSKNTGPGGTVLPCSTNPTGNYVVWQRLPSFATSNWNAESTYWPSIPFLNQFKQMYTTNPITDLTGQSHTPEYQYFYCSS